MTALKQHRSPSNTSTGTPNGRWMDRRNKMLTMTLSPLIMLSGKGF